MKFIRHALYRGLYDGQCPGKGDFPPLRAAKPMNRYHHHHHHFRLMIMVDKRIHTIDNKNRRKMVSRPTR